ncbi:TetR/AcrR family transcriptional regulator C-terminal domain-containing protein [Streptomyces sp. Tue 6430]|nr:TetR/AcrR family transcriptional regulator C-terminal domain-containing protein [Streptomyces sp. Tue 6430]
MPPRRPSRAAGCRGPARGPRRRRPHLGARGQDERGRHRPAQPGRRRTAPLPELGQAWHGRGPEVHHPAVAGALRALADQGRLVIPDLEAAIIQLYALLVFPHMVFSTYGTHVDDGLTDRLVVSGVDMFLGYYGPGRDG